MCGNLAQLCSMMCALGGGPDLRSAVAAKRQAITAHIKSLFVRYSMPYDKDRTGEYVWRAVRMEPGDISVWTSHSTDRIAAYQWPERRRVTLAGSDKDHCSRLTEWPAKRMYSLERVRKGSVPAHVVQDPFVLASGVWTVGFIDGPVVQELAYDVMRALRDERYLWHCSGEQPQRRLRLELFASSADAGRHARDLIELDEKHGWAVLAREWKDERGKAVMRMDVLDFVAADSSRVWLPRKWRVVRYGSGGAITALMTLDSCAVNDVAARGERDVPELPGAVRMDPKDSRVTQVVAGGLDYIDGVASRLQRHVRGKRRWRTRDVVWMLVFAALGFASFVAWKHGRAA